MTCISQQALYLLALNPVAECIADNHAYDIIRNLTSPNTFTIIIIIVNSKYRSVAHKINGTHNLCMHPLILFLCDSPYFSSQVSNDFI